MKRFIKHIIYIVLPFIIIAIIVQFFDFFKVYKSYNNYFKDNRISINRTVAATKTFLKYKDSISYNTFVFGNSRAQAFKDYALIKHFGESTKPFHFDSNNESLYGIYKKLEFLSLQKANLKNIIIVLDASLLEVAKARNTFNYINPPVFNDVSKLKYYSEFIKTSCQPKFIAAVADFSIFKTKRGYIKKYILTDKHIDTYKPISLDCSYGNEIELKKDSVLYYKKVISKIKNRASYRKEIPNPTRTHLDILHKIKRILKKHNSNYTIIISPLYDQAELNNNWKKELNLIFTTKHVFNFSGKNKYTEPINNYYEWSHYKSFVAEKLLDSIHKKRAN